MIKSFLIGFKASTTEVIILLDGVVLVREDWNCWYGWLGTRVCVARFLRTTNPGDHPSEN